MKNVVRASKRVVLRPIEESDLPYFVAWINNPEINKYLGNRDVLNLEKEKEWFESIQTKKDRITLSIEADGKVIGNIGIFSINHIDGTATTGTMIGDPKYHGKGYGFEAKMLLLDYAFNTLGLRKICSQAYEFNKRSIRYSLKCGYVVEGRLYKHRYYDGRHWDVINLAVWRKNWLPIWEEFKKEKM